MSFRLPLLFAIGLIAASAPPAARPDQGHVARTSDHALGLAGAPNFRDLGGYRTRDGRTVRRGLVFRSSKLAPLTPVDWARVETLGIHGVYDLRTVEERHAEPDNWPQPPATVYASPKPDMAGTIAAMRRAGSSPAAVRGVIIGFYRRMPIDYAPEYAAFFKGLAGGATPVVVHCTAGKDRTGVASALLLTALGVPRATVVDDYEMTERLLVRPAGKPGMPVGGKAGATMATLPPAAQDAVWRSDPVYIRAALETVDARYGSIDGYMRRALGMSAAEIAALRKNLLT